MTIRTLISFLIPLLWVAASARADVVVLHSGQEVVGRLKVNEVSIRTDGVANLIIPLSSIRTLRFHDQQVVVELSDGRQVEGTFAESIILLESELLVKSFPVDQISEVRVTAHDETFPLPIEEIDPKLQYPPRQERLVLSIPLSELREHIAFRRQLDNLPIVDTRIKNISILREKSGRKKVSLDLKFTVEVGRSHDREVEVEISATDGATKVQGARRRFEVEEEKTRTVSLTVKLDREFFERAVSNQGRLQISITAHDD